VLSDLGSIELALLLAMAGALGVLASYLLTLLRRYLRQREIERVQRRSIRAPGYGKRSTLGQPDTETGEKPTPPGTLVVESLSIRNLRNIGELDLCFARDSSLVGRWTCIAGINGAGKTTILQALCMVLLGSDLVIELGRVRLRRMLRRTADGVFDAEIEAVVRQGTERHRLYLPLNGDGVDEDTLRRQPDFDEMRSTWRFLREQVLVSYGASRNVSEYKDPRHSNVSRAVQRQTTLFDPLTQIASGDVLLEADQEAAPAIETLYRLLHVVLASEGLIPEQPKGGGKLQFSQHDAAMDVLDLPDGFRSTVAWMADLCTAWHERAGGEKADVDPTAITGIVLLDEVGLHLHPSLEKALVPQLRKALPTVQFIVTTHSPMVLSSFDRSELVVLDASTASGTQELDRQVFGLSMDDIYAWLMDTSPGSQVMEEMLEESSDPELAVYLYQSKDVDEDRAREILEEREKRIAKLRSKVDES